jgi:hypothetical protein
MSDGELAMSEFGALEEVILALRCVLSISLGCSFVVVCGGAVVVRDAHVHVAGMRLNPPRQCARLPISLTTVFNEALCCVPLTQ